MNDKDDDKDDDNDDDNDDDKDDDNDDDKDDDIMMTFYTVSGILLSLNTVYMHRPLERDQIECRFRVQRDLYSN